MRGTPSFGSDDSTNDKVNQALEEAEQKMSDQDSVIERARRHLNAAESGEKLGTLPPVAPQTAPVPSAGIAPAAPVVPAPQPDRKKADEIANRASVVYRDKREYNEAYELADEALRIDPKNSKAKRLKAEIENNLEQHIEVASPIGRRYQPPEGMVEYKIAVSDQLITKQEAVEIGLKGNVQLQALEKRLSGAERKLLEAKRALFPTVGAEITNTGGRISGNKYTGETIKLNFSHPIFDGGELLFTLRQAEANVESDKAKFAKERSDFLFRVCEAYRGTVNADYNLAYQTALNQEVSTVKIRVDKEYEMKLASEVEYLNTLQINNQVNFQHEAAMSDLVNAKLILAQEMGIDSNLPLPVDTNLKYSEINLDLQTIRHLAEEHNWDVRVKEISLKGAYYALRIFSAKKMPKVELRGSYGKAGEQAQSTSEAADDGSSAILVDPFDSAPLDLETEAFIGVETSMPIGPHSVEYGFNRRMFAPTVSSFQGSTDYKHRMAFNLFDRLADMTDEEIAEADYLQAKADLERERLTADVKAQEAYYNYKSAVLQLNTSLSKIKYREKQVNILRVTTGMQEAATSSLLEELVQLTEDRYSYVKAITDILSAVENINRIIGIDGYYSAEPLEKTI